MSAPIFLGPLGELRNRSFAFYPAIVGIEHNEWTLRSASWHDVHVVNTKSQAEIVVPRRLVGEVSSVEAPVVIVGLVKELEYREGAVVAHRRKVIEMPRAVNGPALLAPLHEHPAPVIAIRTEAPSPTRRWLRGGVAAGVIACIAAGVVLREAPFGVRYGLFRSGVRPLRLSALDDEDSVVAKLGRPTSSQWLRTGDGTEYRRLWYARRGLAIILAGSATKPRYAGAINGSGRVLHATAPALVNLIAADTGR